jgi:hypothetical protein
MSRKLLRAVSAAVAGAALVAGPMAGAGAGAQAGQAQLPVLIGDTELQTYASYSEISTWQDPYVRMLPPDGSTANAWEFRDSTAGGTATAIVHLDSGGCLQPDLDSAELYVEVAECARDGNESWEVQNSEKGTVFVHVRTETCLTRKVGEDGTGFDLRLTLAKCHGGEAQLFSLVV